MSSIYFLKCLGFNDVYHKNDKQLKVDHELVREESNWYDHDDCYWDDFQCEMARLTGLKMNNNNNVNVSHSNAAMLLIFSILRLFL